MSSKSGRDFRDYVSGFLEGAGSFGGTRDEMVARGKSAEFLLGFARGRADLMRACVDAVNRLGLNDEVLKIIEEQHG